MKIFALPRTAALFGAVSVVTAVSLALVMSSCAPAAPATPIPTIALTSTGPSEIRNVQASAVVVPAQEAHLSFAISGPIKEVLVKEGETVEAGQTLAILSSPDLEYSVLQAEAAVRMAEFEKEYWRFPRRGDRTVERRQLAEQAFETAKRSLVIAQAELAQTTLGAPFAATVISVEIQPGEFVAPGQVVIVVAGLDNLQIETTDLSEQNVAMVQIDQPASIYVDALDEEFFGKVIAISPIPDTLGSEVVYTVTIDLDEQPRDLLWGMSAEVEILTEQ